MRPQIHWIDAPIAGRLAIMPRPRANDWLEDEIAGWRAEGIDIVISLLEPNEIVELGLSSEATLCIQNAMEFISFPIADRGLPRSIAEATELAQQIARNIEQGKAIAVHCRAGIGRSSVIAASAMVCLGMSAANAFAMIAKARGVDVPDTDAQRDWVQTFERNAVS